MCKVSKTLNISNLKHKRIHTVPPTVSFCHSRIHHPTMFPCRSTTSNLSSVCKPDILRILVCRKGEHIESHDPSIESCDPSIESHDPSIESHDPSIESCDPSIEPCDPSIESCDPSIESCDPSIKSHDVAS